MKTIILETAVKTRILAQHLDTPSAIKNCLITNKVTSTFFITPGKSICYTKRSRLTAVSRIIVSLAWLLIIIPFDLSFSKNLTFNDPNNLIAPSCLQPFFPLLWESPDISNEGELVDVTLCKSVVGDKSFRVINGVILQEMSANELYGYRYYGKTNNDLNVISGFQGSTRGSGRFAYLFLIKQITKNNKLYLRLVKTIDLGDRCQGGLKKLSIVNNTILMTVYHGDNAADCDDAKTNTEVIHISTQGN